MKSISLLSWIYDFIRLLNKGSLDSFVSTMTRPFQDKRDLQTSLNFSRLLLKFRLPSNTLVINTYNTQRETTSAGFHACSLSWSNLHLESWFLWRKGNWIAWRKPLRGRLEPKTNSAHIKDRARSESGPHWQEASALTTVPSLLPKIHVRKESQLITWKKWSIPNYHNCNYSNKVQRSGYLNMLEITSLLHYKYQTCHWNG